MDTWTASGRHWTEGTVRWRQCRELYFCLYSPTVLVLTHPIAHTNLSEDILGLQGILFQLSADVRHVDTGGSDYYWVHIGTPDGIHDIAVGQDSAEFSAHTKSVSSWYSIWMSDDTEGYYYCPSLRWFWWSGQFSSVRIRSKRFQDQNQSPDPVPYTHGREHGRGCAAEKCGSLP